MTQDPQSLDLADPVVDLWFALRGTTVPSLHGHLLYAAVSDAQPALHGAPWLGIHTLHGARADGRTLSLPRGTRLGLRMPTSRIALALALAGKTLRVGAHELHVGLPEIRPLDPASSVSARMVSIKGFTEPEPFAEAVRRQLDALGVTGAPEFGPRLVQQIEGKLIVGFAMRVHGLSEADSVRLQAAGIGGRRRMGCGLFRPSRVGPPEVAPS